MIAARDTEPRHRTVYVDDLAQLGLAAHSLTDLTAPAGSGRGFGWHLILDLGGCDPAKLEDPERLRKWITTLVPSIGMKAHGDPLIEYFGEGDLAGYTVMQLIKTSSITAHCEPYPPAHEQLVPGGRLHADVFSCKDFDPIRVVTHTIRHLGGTGAIRAGGHATFLRRG